MKELIMNQILDKMTSTLSEEQLQSLKDCLYICFYNVEMKAECTELSTEVFDNHRLLNLFLAFKRVGNRKESTLNNYKSTIKNMLNRINKPIPDIKSEDIGFYLAEYKINRGTKSSSIGTIRHVLSSFFTYLTNHDYILKNPMAKIEIMKKEKRVHSIVSEEDIQKIRNVCPNKRELALFDFLLETGARVSECSNAKISDIDWNKKSIKITGKGNKERIVYMTPACVVNLQEYLSSRNDDNDSLFVSLDKNHRQLQANGIRTVLTKLSSLAKVHHIHPHKLRHTKASMLASKGMKLQNIQKILGHENIQTTMIYCETVESDVSYEYFKCA